ncbi:MAG: aldo/keto reductase [uncultured bacterium]|nr:MAG: aldo/keto reductase [uncultured bacterium]HCS39237.1 2,5-didehydrogluconate reductase [Anaerolineaceae bacterium]
MEQQSTSKTNILGGLELGIGTWAWGDRLVWGYGNQYSANEVEETFHAAIDNGIRFFDTAEVYGQGKSEKFIGQLLPSVNEKVMIATKIMPYPWRLSKDALRKTLAASLKRLGLKKVDLYQMHWPMPPVSVESWMQQMSEVYEEGLISAIGVSNYNLELTKRSMDALQKKGIPLASNQVEYHLLERRIEKDGLVNFCNANDIKVIAYSPLAMGILSGKYTPENPPKGTRSAHYNRALLEAIQPLIKLMKGIGLDHEGKTASQVALNWVICKGALAIPGAKNITQVEQNAGAIGWHLTDEEVRKLDESSNAVSKIISRN